MDLAYLCDSIIMMYNATERPRKEIFGVFITGLSGRRAWLNVRMEAAMINFEEELKHFMPSLEVEEAESAIYNHDLTDVTDIISEMMKEIKRPGLNLP